MPDNIAEHAQAESRPQDMAIWRAILAGDEWFALARKDGANRKNVVKALRFLGQMNAVHIKFVRYEHVFLLRAKLDAAPRDVERRFGIWRFVLFTHPFTGGRAVFSEPVD